MKRVSVEKLIDTYITLFMGMGFSKDDASMGAKVLAMSDEWGDRHHGGTILPKLHKLVEKGGMNADSDIEILNEDASWAMVDGHNGLGYAIACKCMDIAIEKAKKSGIGMVGVKRSTHFGCAGYYTKMASRADMFGLAMSNVNPVMTIPRAFGRVLGNNPLSYAAPRGNGDPLFMDVAMSKVAGARIHDFASSGKKIPDGWLIDSDGNWVNDPAAYHKQEAQLVPMAEHKGYGFAVLVEILAGIFTGAGVADGVVPWDLDFRTPPDQGHFFFVIDINKFLPIDIFKGKVDYLVDYLKGQTRIEEREEIFVPGEIEIDREKKAAKNGVELDDFVVKALEEVSEALKINLKL